MLTAAMAVLLDVLGIVLLLLLIAVSIGLGWRFLDFLEVTPRWWNTWRFRRE